MVEKTSVLSWRGSDKYYNPYIGRGEVLFTGPDGIRDHDTTVLDPNTYVGIGTMSPEGTSDLNYLWRPSKGCTHPLPKSAKVGEIGWGLQFYKDRHHLRSGHQIKHGEFRQATEDRHTHLYQNPWYAGPNDKQPDEAGQDNQVPLCSRSERHMTPVGRYSSRSFRSLTPTPQRFRLSEAQRQTTPRSHSAGPRTRSGTLSSSTSLYLEEMQHPVEGGLSNLKYKDRV